MIGVEKALFMTRNYVLSSLRMGWVMGFEDFKRLGAGTKLGRFWPTIAVLIRITFIGLVFSLVFQSDRGDYLPWLASGFITWTMMSSVITAGSLSFSSSKGLMLTLPIPKEAFILRNVVREALVFTQNLAVMAGVFLVFQTAPSGKLLLFIPGLLISLVFLTGLLMILGPLVARFKDLGQFISAIMGVMLFVLPVMWEPGRIQSDLAHLILGLNPLYHFLQVVRLPLIDQVPTDVNYLLALGGAVAVLAFGIVAMAKTRDRLVYWS